MTIRRRSRRPAILALLVVAALASGRPAVAGYIATDLGSGDSYNLNAGYTLSGPQGATGLGYGLAVEFQVTGNTPVAFGGAKLALEYHSGTDALTVMLMSNAGGMPGSTLETMQVGGISTGPSLVSVVSATQTLLMPGTEYWLAAETPDDSYFSWMMNGQGSSGDVAYRLDHGSGPQAWQPAGSGTADVAFGIMPAAVPSPSSATLLGIGMIGLGGFGAKGFSRRRRAAP